MEDRSPEVTPAPDKTPEQIEQEMAQTRESITEKVAALENQVVGTVKTAADTLTGTVEAVKSLITTAPGQVSETVQQAASVVSEKVKEFLDVSGYVRERPWTAVGVSAGVGFLTGLFAFGRGGAAPASAAVQPAFAPPAAAKPGMFDEMFSMLGRKLREVAETAIESATTAVNRNVKDGIPTLVDAAAQRLTPDPQPEPAPGQPHNRFARPGYFG